ncbi:hypothetical protein PR048_017891 [Dryococelus australis]|uniref:Uncharacterized protein n=1 Tax=Dryococelus australis TaxID=614101 RepID=A0ABQ9HAY1_9NEOP|nr:hypothetical protein PR048_017891 [Dryococelus australis]
MSPLKETPSDMCVTERGNEDIQSSVPKIPRVGAGSGRHCPRGRCADDTKSRPPCQVLVYFCDGRHGNACYGGARSQQLREVGFEPRNPSELESQKKWLATWLGRSPPTVATRARYPAGSLPDFRMWESCWTMPLAGGLSWGTPASPTLAFQRRSILGSHFMSCPGMTGTYGSQLESQSLGRQSEECHISSIRNYAAETVLALGPCLGIPTLPVYTFTFFLYLLRYRVLEIRRVSSARNRLVARMVALDDGSTRRGDSRSSDIPDLEAACPAVSSRDGD